MKLTPRENALLMLQHKIPERIPDFSRDANHFCRSLIHEKGPITPEFPMGGTGKDWFGVQWVHEKLSNAPMVDPSVPPVLTDITKWREQVTFPDLSTVDFKAAAEAELSAPTYDPDKLNFLVIMTGPFERLLDCMGCEEALVSMLEEPEACREFFDAVIDYKIELIDRITEYYPIDLIDFHDDWGTQISTFFSVETWNELLAGPISRVNQHCKDKGIHFQMHSCGRMEAIVPELVKLGVEHWSSCQTSNDIKRLVHEFGDRLTFFGGMDLAEARLPGTTEEDVYRIISAWVDDICRGGCVIPLGSSSIPYLPAVLPRVLSEREDFFTKPENRVLP